jgi:hypothetical protein
VSNAHFAAGAKSVRGALMTCIGYRTIRSGMPWVVARIVLGFVSAVLVVLKEECAPVRTFELALWRKCVDLVDAIGVF